MSTPVSLDPDMLRQIDILKRQYLQLIEPDQLSLPVMNALRFPEVQALIFHSMFNLKELPFPPPDRYRFRVLKKIVYALEQSIVDPEKDVGFSMLHC